MSSQFATTRRDRPLKLSFKLSALLIASAVTLVAAAAPGDSGGRAVDGVLAGKVPPGVTLRINSASTQVALETNGQTAKLPFNVSWVGGPTFLGPQVIEAFRGGHLDLNTGDRELVPVQAHYSNLPAKIVGVQLVPIPTYQIVTAPHSNIHSVKQLRGKTVAIAPGQGTGLVTLEALKAAGIPFSQVHFVQLQSSDVLSALEGGQVDAGALGFTMGVGQYLQNFKGTHVLANSVDLVNVAWAPVSVLNDPAKRAAIREFVKVWEQQTVWAWKHPKQWEQAYFVKYEGLSPQAAQTAFKEDNPKPDFPDNWSTAIKWTQESIDTVTQAGWYGKPFNAGQLFDMSFEKLSDQAVPAQYRADIGLPKA